MARTRKRNAKGAGTIRQRPDGKWEARYTAGYNSGTGKQIQKSVYGKTQAEVLKKLQQIQVSVEQGTHIEPSKITVEQWLDVWAEEYLVSVKGSTVFEYKGQIRNHIKPALGALLLQKVCPHDVQKFYNNLGRKNNLSPKTIRNIHGIFHSSLVQAVKIGYIRTNPADGALLPRIEKQEITTLSAEDTPRFLERIEKSKFEALYYVTLFTGMRQGEVLGLTWDCVDFEKGTLHIKHQLQRDKLKGGGYYRLVPLKNDKPRTLTPAKSVMDKLREQKKKQIQDRLSAGSLWDNPLNLVFTNEFGGRLSPGAPYTHYKKIVADLGYPKLRFHDLRHSYAVNSLRSGDDIKTLQGNMGHHTAAFTLDCYAHITDEMKQDSSDRMEKFITSLSS